MPTAPGATKYLHGEKVRLKTIESDDDLKFVFRSQNDPEATGPFVNFEPVTWDAFQTFSKEWSKPPFEFSALLIERNEDKKIIGYVVHFSPNPIFKGSIEIGYAISEPSLRGKGYTTEAAGLLVDYLFSTKMIVRIQATTSPKNSASQRVVEKLGFKKEGVLRNSYFANGHYDDSVIFGLLREEWESKREQSD
jgi:[ribosomal protein S5]-alanine N-acetyltransferase